MKVKETDITSYGGTARLDTLFTFLTHLLRPTVLIFESSKSHTHTQTLSHTHIHSLTHTLDTTDCSNNAQSKPPLMLM
ncbi:hypothetical protein L1987_34770 [Smallanthus sonchifolius]|uniref:Uncharacterized protein n=1 Tax=Smallanthus sonchifolius TaxID=185202 RepID=A0ACB9HV56_9ASTR|nr:hypothetical protein L1987_34770 [Smallanthus sonchifolius]